MGRTIEEMKMVWGLKDELEKLKTKFSNLQLFLKDVGSANHADKRVQVTNWLLQVRDAGYVADDIIDDYDYEIIRRECEQKNQCLIQFQDFFTGNNPIVFRFRMYHEVRDALAMFDELDKNARSMGLKDEIIAGTSANNDQGGDRLSQARKYASANASEFVGREDEMKILLQILRRPTNDQEPHISTVAILGLGGLGKTTFARCLYDSKDIEAHFENKLWISVGHNFSILRILNEMLEYVTSNKGNLCNIDAIINKLQENLKNKKYLLVLDDVWCDDQELWSNLKNALQRIGGLPGCLILITTRLIEVTRRSRAETHFLRELSEEAGWALLKQRVSVGGTSPNFSILEEIGKKIVAKCQGVPLAIKAIGGILQSKQLPSDWELIEKSEIWKLPQNNENQILRSLRLTFDHLPSPALKQCFAYCAAFCPRGYLMEKDGLVDIWLAQGFLHESEINNLTMEEIGEKYLMVLLNYSLLNYSLLEETIVFPGLEFIELRDCPELETIPALDYFQSLKKLQLSKVGIQSLDITKHKTSSMLSSEVNLKLETLEIYNCEQLLSLPSELQYITSLKTMKLTNCPALTSLPNNIPTNLEKRTSLATFTIEGRSPDFSNSSVKTVNHVSFPSLIELEIYRCGALKTCLLPPSADSTNVFPRLEVLRVTNCPELETLPTLNFQSLKRVNLENLSIRSFSIASPKVNMKLELLVISKCEKLVSLPSELQFGASFKTLRVNDCPALTSLPNNLFQEPDSLSELSICRCEALSNIPTSLEKCTSLATLTIQDCPYIEGPTPDFSKLKGLQHMYKSGNPTELMISMLKAVEHLPNLTKLATGKLKDEVEHEMYFSDVTPIQRSQSLKELHLNGNPNIKSLPEQLQLLTQIEYLTIYNFDDLEELPEWVGRLSSLEVLWFHLSRFDDLEELQMRFSCR